MTTTPANASEMIVGQARLSGNATVHRVYSWTDSPQLTTRCGADTRFVNKRLISTTDAVTCGRCSK